MDLNRKKTIIKTQESSESGSSVVMCRYLGCKEPATMKIINANTTVCDDHYLTNVLRFGCQFDVEILKTGEIVLVDA